ncbi:MAG: tail fiber domain-containing protein, partial [Schleiferiaceae bacterium]
MSTLKTTNIAHPSSASNNIVLDSSARVLIGTSTSRGGWFNGTGFDPLIQTETTTQNVFSGVQNSNSALGPWILLGKSRGTTAGAVTAVQNDDPLGGITFQGADGTEMVDGARIQAFVDTTPGANDVPTRLVFSTTSDSAASPTERARFTSLGAFKATTTGSYNNAANFSHEFVNGNTSGNYGLFLVHSAATSTIYGMGIRYTGQTPNNTSSQFIICDDPSATRFAVRSNGGIENYSANNVNFCDEREKKNIVNLDSTWDCLKHWELKKFHYNEDADTDDLRYGVIAQQVADYCPEVISEWVKQKAEPAKLDDEGNEIEPAKEEILRMAVKEQ